VNSSKAEIHANYHKIPRLQFSGEQKLTSYAGLVIFQALFAKLQFKSRLQSCFEHLSGAYGHGAIVMLLVVHLLLGFRRLRGLDYYRDDPLVARVVGLRQLPDVATVSRTLSTTDAKGVENLRTASRELVLDRLRAEDFSRVTLDFDGSVQSTTGHAEGTAIGFNKKKKGARSYYPLFCTVAQTDQFFDLYHRPGNVHDSNGSLEFMDDCFKEAYNAKPDVLLESRIDSAFFNDDIIWLLEAHSVEFTCSVPFDRFAELKGLIEKRQRWTPMNDTWAFFETSWKPKSWDTRHRFLFLRQRKSVPHKGPLQLDFFEPRDTEYDYKVIATNKTTSAEAVLSFHNGRGSQEKIYGEAKQHVALDLIPTRRMFANQTFTLAGMLAHNLSRELQMSTRPAERNTLPKRPSRWEFMSLGTIRQKLLHKAGQLTRPQGELTLTLNANDAVGDLQTTNLPAGVLA
jgi:hypothetical protein